MEEGRRDRQGTSRLACVAVAERRLSLRCRYRKGHTASIGSTDGGLIGSLRFYFQAGCQIIAKHHKKTYPKYNDLSRITESPSGMVIPKYCLCPAIRSVSDLNSAIRLVLPWYLLFTMLSAKIRRANLLRSSSSASVKTCSSLTAMTAKCASL